MSPSMCGVYVLRVACGSNVAVCGPFILDVGKYDYMLTGKRDDDDAMQLYAWTGLKKSR